MQYSVCNKHVQTAFDKLLICTAIMHIFTDNNELLVSEEAARLLRLSKASLWDKCRGQNPIPHIRLNSRTFRFRKSDLELWLKERSR